MTRGRLRDGGLKLQNTSNPEKVTENVVQEPMRGLFARGLEKCFNDWFSVYFRAHKTQRQDFSAGGGWQVAGGGWRVTGGGWQVAGGG